MQAGALGGPPAALASNDFEGIRQIWQAANDNRLDQSALPNGIRQFRKLGIIEDLSGVSRVGANEFDRNLSLPTRTLHRFCDCIVAIPDEGCESASEAAAVVCHGHVSQLAYAARHRCSRWITSDASLR